MPRGSLSASRFAWFSLVALSVALAGLASGCATQQVPDTPAAAPDAASLRPLPFKGKLVSGNPAELPPIVAMSLSDNSPVTFSYREDLTHEEHHAPMLLSALENLAFASSQTGEFEVTAFASLSISSAGRPIGDYTAKAHITRPYSMFSQPTHRELDDAARAAVRDEIDRKVEAESARLAASVGETE